MFLWWHYKEKKWTVLNWPTPHNSQWMDNDGPSDPHIFRRLCNDVLWVSWLRIFWLNLKKWMHSLELLEHLLHFKNANACFICSSPNSFLNWVGVNRLYFSALDESCLRNSGSLWPTNKNYILYNYIGNEVLIVNILLSFSANFFICVVGFDILN